MSNMDSYAFYLKYHSNPINKLIHTICIPLIMLTSMIFLKQIYIHNRVDIVMLLIPVYSVYYFSWGLNIGVIMTLYLIALELLAEAFNGFMKKRVLLKYNSIVFVLAWILQFVGHYIEGAKPALMDSVSQAFMVAPLFSLDFLFFP